MDYLGRNGPVLSVNSTVMQLQQDSADILWLDAAQLQKYIPIVKTRTVGGQQQVRVSVIISTDCPDFFSLQALVNGTVVYDDVCAVDLMPGKNKILDVIILPVPLGLGDELNLQLYKENSVPNNLKLYQNSFISLELI